MFSLATTGQLGNLRTVVNSILTKETLALGLGLFFSKVHKYFHSLLLLGAASAHVEDLETSAPLVKLLLFFSLLHSSVDSAA